MRTFLLLGLIAMGCETTGLPTTGGTNGTTGGTGGTTGGTGGTTGGTGGTTGGTTGSTVTLCGPTIDSACKSDEWCDFPDGAKCGASGELGTCKKRPQACDLLYQPVCGCDSITYSNACSAEGSGVDVLFEGECEPPPPPGGECGGWSQNKCAPDEYCYFTPGQYCDWADGSGTCTKKPDICNDLYDPVCGCDSKDYGNECDAAANGVGVAYHGKCGDPSKDCRNTRCDSGKRCELCWTSWECLDPNIAC